MNQLKQFAKDGVGAETHALTEGSNSQNATTEASFRAKKLSLDVSLNKADALRNTLTPLKGAQFDKVKQTENNQYLGFRTLDDFTNEDGNFDEIATSTKNASLNSAADFDIARIIHELKNPKDLNSALQDYVPRNKNFKMEDLLRGKNTKIQRFKDCIYFGHVTNGNRQGKGIMIYNNGRVYEGDWENNVKHGKGVEISPNGNNYDGDFLNGKPEGIGTFIWKHGEVYKGEWRGGLKHGSGMWKGTKGESYVGEWKNGKPDGHGIHTWRNGDRYEGEYMSSLKHGHGTERFANGDFFMGAYENGKPNGFGEYYWSTGSSYKGIFKNGLRHGNGTWRKGFGKSDVYEGEWTNDKKCGTGIYTWLSGNCYKGEYFDDLRHGYGEMHWTDGSVYKGQWRKGLQHGEGELYTPGRQVLSGMFRENIFCGLNDNEDFEEEGSNPSQPTDPIEEKLPPMLKKSFKLNDQMLDLLPHRPPTGRMDFSGFRSREKAKGPSESRTLESRESSFILAKDTSYYHNTSPSESLPYRNSGSNNMPQSKSGLNNRNSRSISPGNNMLLRNALPEKASVGRSVSNPRPEKKESNADLNQSRSFQTQKLFHSREGNHGKKLPKSPSPSKEQPKLVSVRPLDAKELLRWNSRKQQLIYNEQKKYEDLNDPQVIIGIREIINPPVWKLWPHHIISPGNSNSKRRITSMNFYKSTIKA